MSDLLYNNETKLKDLTVGQLKDIIIDMLGAYHRYDILERRQYSYSNGYEIPRVPSHPRPNEPYCNSDGGVQC